MSFPRAKIQRFNETPTCSPAPGTYDPKLDTKVKGPVIKKDSKETKLADCDSVSAVKQSSNFLPTFRTPQLPRKGLKVNSRTQERKRNDSSSSVDDVSVKSRSVHSSNSDLTDFAFLRQRLNEAIDELNETKEHCESLNSEVVLKVHQIEELQQRNETLASEMEILQQELVEAHNRHKESLLQVERLDYNFLLELQDVRSMIFDLMDKQNTGIKEMFLLRKELDTLANLKSDLEQKVQHKQQMILLLQSELSAAEVELVEYKSECERKTSEAVRNTEEVQRLSSVINELEHKLEDADKQFRDMRDNLMNGSVVRETLEEELSEKKDALSSMEIQYNKLLTEFQHLKQIHSSQIDLLGDYSKQMNEMVHNVEYGSHILEFSMANLNETCNDKILALQSKIQVIMKEARKTWQEETSLLKKNFEDCIRELTVAKVTAEEEAATLKSESLHKDHAASERIKEVESEARIITEKLLRAEEELRRITDSKDELIKSNLANQLAIVELQDTVNSLTVEKNSLSSELAHATEEHSNLKSQNKKLTIGNRNLNESLDALRVRLLESESDVEEMTIKQEKLDTEKQQLEQELKTKLEELEMLKTNIAQIESENLQQIESVRKDLLEKLESFKHKALLSSQKLHKVENEKQLEIQSLSLQLDMFRNEFEELNKYIAAMEEENEKQVIQLETFQKQQGQLEKAYSSLTSRFEQQSSLLEEKSNELKSAHEKIASQEEQILEFKCRVEQLTAEIESSEARIVELNDILCKAENMNVDHEREIEALTEKVDHQRECAKRATQQIASLEEAKSYQDHQLNILTNNVQQQQEFYHQATSQILGLANSNSEKEQQINSLMGEIAILQTNIDELNTMISNLGNNMEIEQTKSRDMVEEIKLLEADRFVKEEQIRELTADLEYHKDNSNKYITHIASLENVRLEKQEELSETRFKVIALEGEKATIEQTYKEVIADLEEAITLSTSEKHNLGAKLQDAADNITNFSNVKADLELEIHEQSRKYEQLKKSAEKEKEHLEESVKNLQLEKAKLEETVNRSATDLQILKQKSDDQHKQINSLQEEVAYLHSLGSSKDSEAEKTIAKLTADLKTLHENGARVPEFEKQLSEWRKKCSDLESLTGPFKAQLEAYRAECRELEMQKGEVEGEIRELALQYADILGHQNHKQKIRHLVKLKEQNLELKEEVRSLRRTIEKLRKEHAAGNHRTSSIPHMPLVSKGKENLAHAHSPVRKSPVSSPNTKPFAERSAHKNVL